MSSLLGVSERKMDISGTEFSTIIGVCSPRSEVQVVLGYEAYLDREGGCCEGEGWGCHEMSVMLIWHWGNCCGDKVQVKAMTMVKIEAEGKVMVKSLTKPCDHRCHQRE